MKTLQPLLLFCLLYSSTFAQQNAFVSPAGTKFLLYLPPAYSTGTAKHPLLISLHGKGESGDDLSKLTSNTSQQQPSRLIYLNRWPKDRPFIVLSPQFNPPPDVINPPWPAAYIDEVVRYVTTKYRVDLTRIYVTGLSLGGNGTWNYAAAYPEKVAAIIPISGRSDLTKACALKNIPTWAFHGDGDPTAPAAYSIDMVNAINNCKVSARYKRKLTIMHARSHNGWNEVYNGSNGYPIYDWLLKFKKANTNNTAPYVNAGPDRTIKLRTTSFHLYGDYFDSDGSVSSVTWKQVSGSALSLSGTTSSFLKLNGLKTGIYTFELAVTDNQGARSSDQVTLNVVSTSSLPVVNRLVLMNGATDTDVATITEGMVFNNAKTGIRQINIRAESSSNTGSVRFSINADQHTRTVNSPGPYLIKSQSSSKPEWEIANGHYIICATPYTNTGASGTKGLSTCFKIKVIDELNISGCEGAGKIYREVWPGVPGTSVSNIPLSTTPAAKTELTIFESPTNLWDDFGERIRGYICPPTTGLYKFWISSNDNSELWLSTDATAANKRKIAHVNGYTGVRQWTKFSSQQSAAINLQAGTRYYIEALHKEGIDADHLAVAWQLPDGAMERPIPGFRLIPLSTTSGSADKALLSPTSTEPTSPISVNLYPNPWRNSDAAITITGLSELPGDGDIQFMIRTMTGITIYAGELSCNSCSEGSLEIKRTLNPGVYIVSACRGRQRIVQKLIVL